MAKFMMEIEMEGIGDQEWKAVLNWVQIGKSKWSMVHLAKYEKSQMKERTHFDENHTNKLRIDLI